MSYILAILIAFKGKSLLELEHSIIASVVRSALLSLKFITE